MLMKEQKNIKIATFATVSVKNEIGTLLWGHIVVFSMLLLYIESFDENEWLWMNDSIVTSL